MVGFSQRSASKRYEAPAPAEAPATFEQEIAAVKIQALSRGNTVRRTVFGGDPLAANAKQASKHQTQANRAQSYSEKAQSQKSKAVGAGAIQRTFELNKQAVDDVLLDPKDIQREQLLRVMLLDEEAKIDKGEPWGHPISENKLRRFVSYWSGPFSGIKQEFRYFQPVNDVMNNMEAAHLTPGMVFDAFFGVMVFELALSEPENGDIAQMYAWKISAIAFAFITPFALLLPPVTVMHVRVLSCVSRPRLRKFIGKWSDEFSLPHAMRTIVWAVVMVGGGLRAYATHMVYDESEHKLWGWGVAVAWVSAVMICFALSWRTVQMYFDAWLPWEEARQAAESRETAEGDNAFYFSIDGTKVKAFDAAQSSANAVLTVRRLRHRATKAKQAMLEAEEARVAAAAGGGWSSSPAGSRSKLSSGKVRISSSRSKVGVAAVSEAAPSTNEVEVISAKHYVATPSVTNVQALSAADYDVATPAISEGHAWQ